MYLQRTYFSEFKNILEGAGGVTCIPKALKAGVLMDDTVDIFVARAVVNTLNCAAGSHLAQEIYVAQVMAAWLPRQRLLY